MKKIFCVVMSMLLLLAAPLALAEESAADQRSITVMGNASVTLSPDFATMTLGVSSQAKTVAAAQAENAIQMNAVLETLRAQGVAEEDIQTSYFGISPVYDYSRTSEDGGQMVLGYRVENNVQVTVRDLDRLSETLDAAMEAGANQSYNLSFGSDARGEAYDQAMEMAVNEAMRKAELLAGAAKVELGALMEMSEMNAGYNTVYAVQAKMMDSAAGTPIANGTIAVEASVQATFQVK